VGALLLLDLDNTLADREAAFLIWAESKVARWAPCERAAVAFLIEHDDDGLRPRREFFSLVRDHFGLHAPVAALIADYRRELGAALPHVPSEVVEQLRALRCDGWKIAVVTNGETDVQAAKIDQLGVAPLLDACCISCEVGIRKPDPRIFELAAARCGRSLADAWMVGDGEPDIVGAHRASIRSVWLRRARTWPRTDLKPDRTADSLVEALSRLTAAPS
jgi:FMN phosphatase YigB (HAD superfamily)